MLMLDAVHFGASLYWPQNLFKKTAQPIPRVVTNSWLRGWLSPTTK
jgi:hypothetical protein